jgi:hypothetical protein
VIGIARITVDDILFLRERGNVEEFESRCAATRGGSWVLSRPEHASPLGAAAAARHRVRGDAYFCFT